MLTDKEKHRYSRHLILDKVGEEGQLKLKQAKVLVIGAGGLGCPVLQYLAAAGVGTIGIIDFDQVDETNLQRQILFTKQDVGVNKALAASNRLKQLNEFVKYEVYQEKLTTSNALNLFLNYDIVVDGTDNFSTRYLVNDACVITSKPLVYGAIYKFEGQVSVFNYNNGPTYRCLFPEPPKPGTVPSCSDIGVIGVLPGLIGTQQANEALKLILGIGNPLSGKLLIQDALTANVMTLQVKRNQEQVDKVLEGKDDFESNNYDLFCGITPVKNEIDSEELKALLQNEAIQIVDVRDEWEEPKIAGLNIDNFPLDDLEDYIDKISRSGKVVVMCQSGGRSKRAIEILEKEYNYTNLINLKGGALGWK